MRSSCSYAHVERDDGRFDVGVDVNEVEAHDVVVGLFRVDLMDKPLELDSGDHLGWFDSREGDAVATERERSRAGSGVHRPTVHERRRSPGDLLRGCGQMYPPVDKAGRRRSHGVTLDLMTEVAAVTRPGEVPASVAPSWPTEPTRPVSEPGHLAAAELERSRQLHPSRRLSPQQKRLQKSVETQRAVARRLEPVVRAGASVFHGVHVPGVGLAVDHIVVAAGGVFVLTDVPSDRRSPVEVSADGSIARGGVSLDRLAQLLGEAARELAAQAGIVLPLGWSVMTVPVVVIDGRSPVKAAAVAGDVSVLPADLLPRWITDAFPSTLDALGVAQLAGAVDLVTT